MKINFVDNFTYILFLINDYIKNIDFDNREEIESYLKKIFIIIKERYDLNVNGFFEINIYVNDKYGVIIEITKEDIDYYDFFTNKIEMQVNIIKDAIFLLEVDDIFMNNLYLKDDIYKYNNKLYINIGSIDNIQSYENGKLIYGDMVDNIISKN